MEVYTGAFKRVFVFSKFVIKTPYYWIAPSHWFAVLQEQWIYLFAPKKWKEILVPTFGLGFIPITIQPKVDVPVDFYDCSDTIQVVYDYRDMIAELSNNPPSYIKSDVRSSNLGYYKNKLVKLDFTFSRVFLLDKFPRFIYFLEKFENEKVRLSVPD